MKEILLKQFGQYPEMQIVDAVKLLYQSEFSGVRGRAVWKSPWDSSYDGLSHNLCGFL